MTNQHSHDSANVKVIFLRKLTNKIYPNLGLLQQRCEIIFSREADSGLFVRARAPCWSVPPIKYRGRISLLRNGLANL